MDYIKTVVSIICLLLIVLVFNFGYAVGKDSVKPIVKEVPATYSAIQINDLIQHNIILTNVSAELTKANSSLTNIIAEQLKYEQSFSSNH